MAAATTMLASPLVHPKFNRAAERRLLQPVTGRETVFLPLAFLLFLCLRRKPLRRMAVLEGKVGCPETDLIQLTFISKVRSPE